jgi:hypothetical protein
VHVLATWRDFLKIFCSILRCKLSRDATSAVGSETRPLCYVAGTALVRPPPSTPVQCLIRTSCVIIILIYPIQNVSLLNTANRFTCVLFGQTALIWHRKISTTFHKTLVLL